MIKKLAALLLFLHFSVAYSQTIKTDVLVIGGGPSGVAAAIQCARSKVKTLLVQESRIFTQNADTIKNLSIDTSAKFISIKKDDDRWDVVISTNGKTETIKARVVIDATENTEVIKKANCTPPKIDITDINDKSNRYRVSAASGKIEMERMGGVNIQGNIVTGFHVFTFNWFLPIQALVANGADNLLVTDANNRFYGDVADRLPNQLAIGQGAGVTAAYCAFFKTTTSNLKPRIIQGELLDFKGNMLPLADISGDPYWRAIQQICATGLLKGRSIPINTKQQQFVFMPDSIVTTAEVRPVLTEIYTRAFLWFNLAKPGKEFTVGNLLSFISELTLTEPDNLQKKIEKEWSAQYKFKSAFDMERPITRREFAILANKYLNPFARAVDLDGRVVN
jgi:FAD dependent oxidoreductase